MNAIAYLRVSTTKQADEGVSLEAQEAKARAWASSRGLELQVFADAGISGKRASNRPGLQAAIKAACHERAPLVFYSLSRLARSTGDAIAIAKRLEKAGADFVSLSEQIDTTSAAGKMVFRMLAVLAEFERDLASERTKEALGHLRRQGRRVSGRIPFGYDLAGEDLVENAREQRAIGVIRALRASGLSLRAISRELARKGIKTKTGAAEWSAKVVAFTIRRDEQMNRRAAS
jgi:site-specific DNA recombinase